MKKKKIIFGIVGAIFFIFLLLWPQEDENNCFVLFKDKTIKGVNKDSGEVFFKIGSDAYHISITTMGKIKFLDFRKYEVQEFIKNAPTKMKVWYRLYGTFDHEELDPFVIHWSKIEKNSNACDCRVAYITKE